MPDWSYQTVFKPLLFRLPPATARAIAIGNLGRLGKLPLGRRIIDFMGHMAPADELSCEFRGLKFPSRVALMAGIDPMAKATAALDQFGFALIEYGPVGAHSCGAPAVQFDVDSESIDLAADRRPALDVVLAELGKTGPTKTPVFLRLDVEAAGGDWQSVVSTAPIAGVMLPWRAAPTLAAGRGNGKPVGSPYFVFAIVAPSEFDETVSSLGTLIADGKLAGVLIDGAIHDEENPDHRFLQAAALESTVRATRQWRKALGDEALILATGGVHEPAAAIQLVHAGATLVGVDSGMVFSGPGLAKRINENLLQLARPVAESLRDSEHPIRVAASVSERRTHEMPATRSSWFWSMLMGLSMLGGGLLALVIALTRVVLPYDESVVGMTREQLALVNDRLLAFMAHDRTTLAGAMLSVGTLYTGLSIWGVRLGAHWAQQAIIWSAFAGFFSFFLFLGFGYFDSFHAFVTAILFQFLLLTVYARLPERCAPTRLDLWDDGKWKRAQWGQLLFVIHGAILIVAGIAICRIGITSVFVPEDLEFLCTTPEKLLAANPQLVPLVAHDRATFGGMLISCGITVLLTSLWGFRRGHAWVWWMLMIAGATAYLSTILIHHHVGYTSLKHLLPAYFGLGLLCVSEWLLFAYTHDRVTRI